MSAIALQESFTPPGLPPLSPPLKNNLPLPGTDASRAIPLLENDVGPDSDTEDIDDKDASTFARSHARSSISMDEVPDFMSSAQILPPGGLSSHSDPYEEVYKGNIGEVADGSESENEEDEEGGVLIQSPGNKMNKCKAKAKAKAKEVVAVKTKHFEFKVKAAETEPFPKFDEDEARRWAIEQRQLRTTLVLPNRERSNAGF